MADRDLTSADYQRFIDKKGIRPQCPLCQNQDWSLVNETEGRSYGLANTSRHAPDISDLRTASMLLLTCKVCGFTAPILREKIVRELDL